MPFYQQRGDLPRKRHIVFRENGRLLTEEVMGLEGFTGNESILYHLQSPCRVKELGDFTPIEREEWVPEAHAHRRMNTYDVDSSGDEIAGRRTLMWNSDVEISLCRPESSMDYFFRNGEGDEVIFVHEGSGTLETTFGDVPYKDGDYIVVPRGTTYRFVPQGAQRYLVFETPGLIEIPAATATNTARSSRARRTTTATSIHPPSFGHTVRRATSSSRSASAAGTRTTSSTTTRSTSSAGTGSSIHGRSRSTTSSPSPGAFTSRLPRTRPSRGRISSFARSVRAISTSIQRRCRSRITTAICSRRR